MDEKFEKRYRSFCNSLDALEEAKQRDLSDSFVLSGTSAKFTWSGHRCGKRNLAQASAPETAVCHPDCR